MSYSSPDRVETNAARRLANPCDSGRIQRLQLSDYTTSADCYIRAPGWFDAVTAPPPKNSKMSSSTPRKFSEKIAIMERKQNEDVNQFEDIMREVRSITNTNDVPGGVPIPGQPGQLQPPNYGYPHLGGSLPNVAQLHNYGPPNWPHWEQNQRAQRSRSPEAHFHPYRSTGRSHERIPPLHPHMPYPAQHTLQVDQWHQINRARSDPNIHQSAPMHPMYPMVPHNQLLHQMQPGPSGMNPGAMQMPPHMVPGPMAPGSLPPQMAHHMQMSPMQSPVHHMAFPYTNGTSPMQSPMGSPMGSTIMLEERTTPLMELSPPGMMQRDDTGDQGNSMSNLPNLPQMPPNCYHATVGQRHSTGQCGRLVPGPPLTPESQSAPTSPANVTDALTQPQWPTSRTFSNSPESMDIPRVVLTNPDGGHGQHFDCYNDLQHLTLDSNEMASLCNGSGLPEYS